jgi:hypothetical protein
MFSDGQTLGRDMVDVHVIEAATVVRDDAGQLKPLNQGCSGLIQRQQTDKPSPS